MILYYVKGKRYVVCCSHCGAVLGYFMSLWELENALPLLLTRNRALKKVGMPLEAFYCYRCKPEALAQLPSGKNFRVYFTHNRFEHLGIHRGDILVCIKTAPGRVRYILYKDNVLDIVGREIPADWDGKWQAIVTALIERKDGK